MLPPSGGHIARAFTWARLWKQEENQPLSKCPVEEFDPFLPPLKFFTRASVATPVLVTVTHNWCLLSQSGREEWAVMRCL